MTRAFKILIAFTLVVCGNNIARAQLTSVAEPQLIPVLDYRTVTAGSWYFGLTYDYRNIARLVMNSDQLDDDSRYRTTRTMVFRAVYGFNDKVFATAIINAVQKTVTIRLPTVGLEHLLTRGLGDSFFMLGYNVIPWDLARGRKIVIAAGIKAPTGRTDYQSDEIIIHEDMQPGTGSVDWLAWGETILRIHSASPTNLIVDALAKINGENSDNYKFGNEYMLSGGIMFLPEFVGHLTGTVKYRNIGRQKANGIIVSNTGGQWLSVVWDVKADIKSSLFGRFAIEFPVSQKLNGSQLSTSYAASLSLQYVFRK
jgi:hypothetical protein